MFKRKSTVREDKINSLLEEIEINATEPIYDEVKVPSRKEVRKSKKTKLKQEKKLEKKQSKKSKVIVEDKTNIVEEKVTKPHYNIEWADNEVCQARKKQKIPKVEETVDIPLPLEKQGSIKKELDEYFLKNNSDLFIKEGKKRKAKKVKKGKLRSYYKYNNKRFQMPSDLLEYLDKNPNKIEKVASTVLDDELFFKWLGKNSHQFIESVRDFRTFKKKIEK